MRHAESNGVGGLGGDGNVRAGDNSEAGRRVMRLSEMDGVRGLCTGWDPGRWCARGGL